MHFVIAIAARDLEEEFLNCMRRTGAHLNFASLGQGTVTPGILELLGLERTEKSVLFSLCTHDLALKVIRALTEQIGLNSPGRGIALALPLTSMDRRLASQLKGEQPLQQPTDRQEEDLKPALQVDHRHCGQGNQRPGDGRGPCRRRSRRHGAPRQGHRRRPDAQVLRHLPGGGAGDGVHRSAHSGQISHHAQHLNKPGPKAKPTPCSFPARQRRFGHFPIRSGGRPPGGGCCNHSRRPSMGAFPGAGWGAARLRGPSHPSHCCPPALAQPRTKGPRRRTGPGRP